MDCDEAKQMGEVDIFKHISDTPRAKRAGAITGTKRPAGADNESRARCSRLTCFIYGCSGKYGDSAATSVAAATSPAAGGTSGCRVLSAAISTVGIEAEIGNQLLQGEIERKVTRRLN